jgi:RHS repeat-associated protein
MRRLFRMMLLLTIAASSGGVALGYGVGDPPTMSAPAWKLPVGEGLGLHLLTFADLDDDNGTEVADTAVIDCVVAIEPGGRAVVMCNGEWDEWAPKSPGLYQVLVRLDDLGTYADDPAVVYQFTLDVAAAAGCSSCGGGCKGQAPGATCTLDTGVSIRFGLGTGTDGESVGMLRIDEAAPSTALATPAALFYNLENRTDVEVIRSGGNLRQVLTPQLLADIVIIDAYEYHLRFFALADVGSKSGGVYQVTDGDEYKKWVIENPNGVSNYEDLHVTEYVDGATRVRYEYAGTTGTSDWTLTTVDLTGVSAVDVQVEAITWVAVGGSVDERRYVVQDGDSNELYREYEQYTAYGWGDRRTQRRIDPLDLDLTSTWTWSNASEYLVLESAQNANGSWSWYNIGLDGGGDEVVQEIGGWKDQTFLTDPSPTHAGVRTTTRRYESTEDFRLVSYVRYLGGNLVGHTDFTNAYNAGELESTTAAAWQDTGGSSTLDTETYYWNGDQERSDHVVYPDGRREEYDYDDAVGFTPSAGLPGTPPTYDTGGSGYRYREIVHGYNNGGSLATVTGQSTREVVISDAGGLPLFQETWAYTAGGQVRVSWTAWTYDGRFRVTGVYKSNGAYQTTSYTSCCTTTVVDESGIETVTEKDVLGRPATITRSAISSYNDGSFTYPAQAALTTTYDYSTPLHTVVTRSASGLSDATTYVYDAAKRLASVTTASGSGALKTLYEYGATANGGEKVTQYSDYAASATSGTAGVRDRITARYRDGFAKSVTGATVVGSYYDYGSSAGESWTLVATGTSVSSPRYEKTYYDMLARVARIDKPGWTAGAPATLTTTNHYNGTTGLLVRVENAAQGDTLYGYDSLARLQYTCLDVDDDATIDLGETDRVTNAVTAFETADSAWWQVTRKYVYATNSSSTPTEASSHWTRLTGFGASVVAESIEVDALGNQTTSTRTVDRAHALVVQSTVYPDAGAGHPEQRATRGGQLDRSITRTDVPTTYTYDALGHRTHVTDGRSNVTETHYDASFRVDWVEDGADKRTTYVYYGDAADNPGKLNYVQNHDSKKTYYDYNGRGQIVHTWGDVPFPTEAGYDSYGQQTSLKTYRGGSGWNSSTWAAITKGTADQTTWAYHEATGLLNSKTYADSNDVTYTYTSDGKLDVRTWARGVTTDYGYSATTGELTSIDYSGTTPDVTMSYDRLGRKYQVSDAAGTRTFAYDASSLALATETFGTGMFNGKVITQLYQDGTAGTVEGRFAGIQIGTSGDADAYYDARYAYDSVGRLNHVTGPGLYTGDGTNNGAWYTFVSSTDLVDQLHFKNSSATVKGWRDWSYEANRDLVTAVENNWGDLATYSTISEHAYGYDNLARRTYNERSGLAFTGYYEAYGYDGRNELTATDYYTGTYGSGTANHDQDRDYSYDTIGNRTLYTLAKTTQSEVNTEYDSNQLNQYTRTETDTNAPAISHRTYDADGNMSEAYILGDMNCDGVVNGSDQPAYILARSDPRGYATQYPTCDILNGDVNGDSVLNASDDALFTALLAGGNSAMYVVYTWDAENRLTKVEPGGTPQNGQYKAEYKYDWQGGRIEKQVWSYSSRWTLTEHWKFMYADWLLLLELDGLDDDSLKRQYTWGLDLSGQVAPAPRGRRLTDGAIPSALTAAGGIGGLLSVHDDALSVSYVYFADVQGNIGQAVDLGAGSAATSMMAKYQYDAYGNRNVIASTYTQYFGFSTKPYDAESGFAYFGHRYYSPVLGRWISRDPMGERGGLDLYSSVLNAPVLHVDALGLVPPWGGTPRPIPPDVGVPPPTDSKCTGSGERACTGMCQKGYVGHTICYEGKRCYCACPGGTSGYSNPTAKQIIEQCNPVHERVHARDTDPPCPPSGASYPPRDPEGTSEECKAVVEGIRCLRGAAGGCGGDSGCLDDLARHISNLKCPGPCGEPGQCPPGCPEDERQDCEEAKKLPLTTDPHPAETSQPTAHGPTG